MPSPERLAHRKRSPVTHSCYVILSHLNPPEALDVKRNEHALKPNTKQKH